MLTVPANELITKNTILVTLNNQLVNIDITVTNELSAFYKDSIDTIDKDVLIEFNKKIEVIDQGAANANTRLTTITTEIQTKVTEKTSKYKLDIDKELNTNLVNLKAAHDLDIFNENNVKLTKQKERTTLEETYTTTRRTYVTEGTNAEIAANTIQSEINNYATHQKMVENADNLVTDLTKQVTEKETEIEANGVELHRSDLISKLLGEDGIKQSIIRRSLPMFNPRVIKLKISKYIRKLRLDKSDYRNFEQDLIILSQKEAA